jgi:hypothetical protein
MTPLVCLQTRTWLARRCRLAGLASLVPPSSWGRSERSALPFAGGNAPLCRLGAYVAMRASGQTSMLGLAWSSAKVV